MKAVIDISRWNVISFVSCRARSASMESANANNRSEFNIIKAVGTPMLVL